MFLSPDRKSVDTATPAEFIAAVFGYMDLLAARWSARLRQFDPRTNPVPLSVLRVHGVNDRMLLWMMYQAQVEHLQCLAPWARGSPAVAPMESLIPRSTSAFAITGGGEIFAGDFLTDVLLSSDSAHFRDAWDCLLLGSLLPNYDQENRILSWGRHLLKHFRHPSPNQEQILAAAVELGWPGWFDDPLPRSPGVNPKTRLHDAIKGLNRYQKPYLIHFKGDGTGTRVGWEYH